MCGPPHMAVSLGHTRGASLLPPRLKIFPRSSPEAAHDRARRFTPHAVVRILHARRPASQLHDLWAQAPMSVTESPGR
jgi:hypothetical protein